MSHYSLAVDRAAEFHPGLFRGDEAIFVTETSVQAQGRVVIEEVEERVTCEAAGESGPGNLPPVAATPDPDTGPQGG
jgi:hypothetical protein